MQRHPPLQRAKHSRNRLLIGSENGWRECCRPYKIIVPYTPAPLPPRSPARLAPPPLDWRPPDGDRGLTSEIREVYNVSSSQDDRFPSHKTISHSWQHENQTAKFGNF